MSQLQEVVRCYSCETFQVQIKKTAKNKKWTCKICNEKQSLKKVYFTGLGAECRKVVKEFNMKRGELNEVKNTLVLNVTENVANCDVDETQTFGDGESSANICTQPSSSKWTSFLSPEEQQETERAFKPKAETFEDDITDDFDEEMEVNGDLNFSQNNKKRGKKDFNYQKKCKWQKYDDARSNQEYDDYNTANQNTFNDYETYHESRNKKGNNGIKQKSNISSKWQAYNATAENEQNNEIFDSENTYSDKSFQNKNTTKTIENIDVKNSVSSSSRWQKFGEDISNTCKPKSKWDAFDTSEQDSDGLNDPQDDAATHSAPKSKQNTMFQPRSTIFNNTDKCDSKTTTNKFSTAPSAQFVSDFTKKFLLPRP